ncbi:hypothetical protein CJD36_015530 [Flavipsychrobacter stenotrophus]|uniref:Uncharacterized protein n=1 Tax=Flavipsychrobacter stenotrophus TaxID=2077091 RepID=A0A2S7SUA0_9BACT|nr:hypothetical protein CJD36_015530 [Flavipsychrobacter stenotrophus]
MPDQRGGFFVQSHIFFLCAAAKKETKKTALLRIAPRAKGAMLRVVVVGHTALRKLSQRCLTFDYFVVIVGNTR